MKKEVWKEIKENQGRYFISNTGKVRNRYGLVLKNWESKYGYIMVSLSEGGKTRNYSIHRLIAIYFIPNPQKKEQVNHKDENRKNYDIENLEWVTRKENLNHGTAQKRLSEKKRVPVYGIGKDKKPLLYFSSVTDAEKKGFIATAISACLKKRRKTHGGYYWVRK